MATRSLDPGPKSGAQVTQRAAGEAGRIPQKRARAMDYEAGGQHAVGVLFTFVRFTCLSLPDKDSKSTEYSQYSIIGIASSV